MSASPSLWRLLWRAPRFLRAGFILGREGVFADIDPALLPPAARPLFALFRRLARAGAAHRPDGLARAMARLGPSYVKLGQVLAARPDIVGARASRNLERLQDRMAPFPRATAVAIVEGALGKSIDELFVSFGEPVAAASIAQVHRARVRDAQGERDVAVKVLRPGVERRFRSDLGDMMQAAAFAERHSSEARRLRLVETVETVARSVRLEMDFRLEAAAASEFAANTQGDADFRLPAVDWDRTAREALTVEWIDGTPLSDIPAVIAAGHNPQRIARAIIQSFLRHALRDGFFHADMHQGNLFVDGEGRLAAVDFGIMGRLGVKERRVLAEILYGFIVRDYTRVARAHFEAGYVPRHHAVAAFTQAVRAIGEPIHARRADEISMAKLLTLLFEITAIFDMRTRPELLLLQKTMVVVEGVGRKFDPHLDMWSTSEPVVRGWIEENVGPVGKAREAGEAAQAAFAALTKTPELIERLDARLAAPAYDAPDPWTRRATYALWTLAALAAFALFAAR